MAPNQWQNRIVGQRPIPVKDLIDNPDNWRQHPRNQLTALAALLDRLGEAKPIVVRAGTNRIIDGHARVALARKRKQSTITAVEVELTDDEEREALALLDPLAALAVQDAEHWRRLRRDVTEADAALGELVRRLAGDETLPDLALSDPQSSQDVPDPLEEPMTSTRPMFLLYSPEAFATLAQRIDDLGRHYETEGNPTMTVIALLEDLTGAARP